VITVKHLQPEMNNCNDTDNERSEGHVVHMALVVKTGHYSVLH